MSGILRVLILEDDPDIVELLRSVLEPSCECCMARNGLEGLQQVHDGEPDVIVSDIMMPIMDGWTFIKRLRSTPEYEAIPVIFLSALASNEHIKTGYKEGVALYLTKPIDPNRFRRNFDLFVKDHHIVSRPKHKRIDQLQDFHYEGAISVPMPTEDADMDRVAAEPAVHKPSSHVSVHYVPSNDALPSKGMSGVRALLVEDDRDVCQMIYNALITDYELIICNDGISAIDYAVRYKPDVFILDGMLPRLTGYQLTVMLRKNIEFYRAPIVMISGRATQRDVQYSQRLGVNHFLPKPFTAQQLQKILIEITSKEDFMIHQNRVPFSQIHLEKFQYVETHREDLPR